MRPSCQRTRDIKASCRRCVPLLIMPMQCLQGELLEMEKLEERHHKKPFGHHGAKPGLPFCTHEGMGQVRSHSSIRC